MWDKRTLLALGVGLLLCVGIWFAVPYNNFALNNSFVSDGYLPEIVLLILAMLVLVVNPLLRRWSPGTALTHAQLALIVGVMLFGAVLPGNGLMRFFPHALAFDTERINESRALAPAILESDLPAALFPDQIGTDLATPISSQLIDELNPDTTIPWSAWITPMFAWGIVIVAFWVLMIGMGLMVFPQWLHGERLPFPLLRVYHAMIDPPADGALYPPALRSRAFWIGCGLVLFLHSCNGLNIFTGGSFPGFPISWNISDVFTEGVWRGAPGFLKGSRIYFLFVGLAYFMPNRYSFSIWFTVLIVGLFVMYTREYMPQFETGVLYDQGCGALIAMALGVVWLGRRHYGRVMRAALRLTAVDEEERTNALGGRLFMGGAAVMYAWFVWAGGGLFFSALFVLLAVMIMLMVARIVSETGITYIWIIPLTASRLIGLIPSKLTSVSVAFLQEAHYILVNRASAVSAAAMAVIALGLHRKATPASRRQVAGIGIVVLVLGFIVCGAVHLHMGYTMAASFDGQITPITGRGATQMHLGPVEQLVSGREWSWDLEQAKIIVWGIGLAGVLLVLCTRFPAWPLHPIGLIFVHSSIGLRLCISLFVGWLIKSLLLRYGGARAYRAAMPIFLGLIFGEIFANAIWTLIPVLQMLRGATPSEIPHMIIFQYT